MKLVVISKPKALEVPKRAQLESLLDNLAADTRADSIREALGLSAEQLPDGSISQVAEEKGFSTRLVDETEALEPFPLSMGDAQETDAPPGEVQEKTGIVSRIKKVFGGSKNG